MLQKLDNIAPIELLETGLIYRNPRPHVQSVHAYFPSVATLANGEMLATFTLGEAFEAVNLHTYKARSKDSGRTWSLEGRLFEGASGSLMSDSSRIAALPDGEVVGFIVRHDRSGHPDEGLTSTETLGFVPTELLQTRSSDGGHSWTRPERLEPPLVGPSFELCSPITPVAGGKWLLPTSTWRGWDGDCPNGMKTIAFVSYDQGQTWPEYVDILQVPSVIFWESKIVTLADGRLLAAAWGYDESTGTDTPNQYTISTDNGQTWSAPQSTGLLGQTLTPFALKDGRILCVYRRVDRPGLWANLSRLEGTHWVNEAETPLWGTGVSGLTTHSENMSQNFQVLRFGAPCINRTPEGHIFVAFWAVEDCVSNIRWFRIRCENG